MGRHAQCCFLLTPPGIGAVAVIRVVGPSAVAAVNELFLPLAKRQIGGIEPVNPDRLRYGRLVDDGQTLDDVIVAARRGGAGIERVDINCHGGPRVVQRILVALKRRGLTPISASGAAAQAWPTANQIDADALAAVARTQTRRALEFVVYQRTALPRYLESLADQAERNPDTVRRRLEELLAGSDRGRYLTDGATLTIIGPPNAGKSTLANKLFGATLAVVSDQPGTTRDWVAEPMAIGGIPLTLVDTPGAGAAPLDELDALAVRRGFTQWTDADLALLVIDGAAPWPAPFFAHFADWLPFDRLLTVLSKADLPQRCNKDHVPAGCTQRLLKVSAQTGQGMAALQDCIVQALAPLDGGDRRPEVFARRQRRCLRSILGTGGRSTHWAHIIRRGLIGRG